MFTGIIEHTAEITAIESSESGKRLHCASPYSNIQTGESIAVNGVCLTCLPAAGGELVFDISPETLAVTNMDTLQVKSLVNLERAMAASARFGGHYVSGHVDTTARLLDKQQMDGFVQITVGDFVQSPRLFALSKGSITLDGVSLTINQANDELLELMLIPHTLAQTTLGRCQTGHRFNIEFDYLTRIVAHQLSIMQSGKREGEV